MPTTAAATAMASRSATTAMLCLCCVTATVLVSTLLNAGVTEAWVSLHTSTSTSPSTTWTLQLSQNVVQVASSGKLRTTTNALWTTNNNRIITSHNSPYSSIRPFSPCVLSAVADADADDDVDHDEDDEDDGNDDEDDDDLESSLGDWRAFRKTLTVGGLELKADNDNDNTNDNTVGDDNNNPNSKSASATSSASPPFCAENHEVLVEQNEDLAQEYRANVWAHVTTTPEVGGLVVRMPLEVQLVHLMNHINMSTSNSNSNTASTSALGRAFKTKHHVRDAAKRRTPSLETWYERAQTFMEEQMQSLASLGSDEDEDDDSTDSDNMDDDDDMLDGLGIFGPSILSSSSSTNNNNNSNSSSKNSKNSGANSSGKSSSVDMSQLGAAQVELLQLYVESHAHWQEVCLVVEREGDDDDTIISTDDTSKTDDNRKTSTSTSTSRLAALVLNRPMATSMSKQLGQMVLFGVFFIDQDKAASTTEQPLTTIEALREIAMVENFVRAFGEECGVYIGGDDGQEQPATVLHGYADIRDAKEIAPHTGIYRGGNMSDICSGVLSNKYQALDFRFFIGCHEFQNKEDEDAQDDDEDFFFDDQDDGDFTYSYSYDASALPMRPSSTLNLAVMMGKYQPVACARSLVLKHCIGLPTPLWHEALELCGGDMSIISKLEKGKELNVDENGAMDGVTVVQILNDSDDEDDDEDDDDDDDFIIEDDNGDNTINNLIVVQDYNDLFVAEQDDDDDDEDANFEYGNDNKGDGEDEDSKNNNSDATNDNSSSSNFYSGDFDAFQ
jgi:hypothetical protein